MEVRYIRTFCENPESIALRRPLCGLDRCLMAQSRIFLMIFRDSSSRILRRNSADSAVFKFYDDSENVDLDNGSVLNDINATANEGYLKIVVGTTVRYIALYAKKG